MIKLESVMKIKLLILLSCLLFTACSTLKTTNSDASCKNELAFKNGQISLLVIDRSDVDYKRIQGAFQKAYDADTGDIDWKKVKPTLAGMNDSIVAAQILEMLDQDIISSTTKLMAQCCGGCSVAVPLNCSGCDALCEQNRDLIDRLTDFR